MGRVAMPDEVSAGTALNLKRESLDRDYGSTFHNCQKPEGGSPQSLLPAELRKICGQLRTT